MPVELQPHLRWRMERVEEEALGQHAAGVRAPAGLIAALLADLHERGPLSARELAHHDEPRGKKGPWWDWSDVKAALEYLFFTGRITSARRRRFERLYDIPERVLPAEVIASPTPAEDEAQRQLVRVAARAMGVATEPDLRDYFRLSAADGKPRVAELVEAGELLPVEVEGWGAPAYLHPGARVPRRVDAAALVGPFDSLIWNRPRVERLFGFRYRIEIYVPKPKRVHGYYVLPFLLGDAARRSGRPEERPRGGRAARAGRPLRAGRTAGDRPRTGARARPASVVAGTRTRAGGRRRGPRGRPRAGGQGQHAFCNRLAITRPSSYDPWRPGPDGPARRYLGGGCDDAWIHRAVRRIALDPGKALADPGGVAPGGTPRRRDRGAPRGGSSSSSRSSRRTTTASAPVAASSASGSASPPTRWGCGTRSTRTTSARSTTPPASS